MVGFASFCSKLMGLYFKWMYLYWRTNASCDKTRHLGHLKPNPTNEKSTEKSPTEIVEPKSRHSLKVATKKLRLDNVGEKMVSFRFFSLKLEQKKFWFFLRNFWQTIQNFNATRAEQIFLINRRKTAGLKFRAGMKTWNHLLPHQWRTPKVQTQSYRTPRQTIQKSEHRLDWKPLTD